MQWGAVTNIFEIDKPRAFFDEELHKFEMAVLCGMVETKLS
jgi:hypothetical protein